MIAKLARVPSGRLWLILGTLAFGGMFAIAIQRPDVALAQWTDARTIGYDVNAKGRVEDLLLSKRLDFLA